MEDWSYCQQALRAVSRTFSQPIEMLEGNLQVAVTCGYLLCRVVDTVEDDDALSRETQDALYASFLGVLDGTVASVAFTLLYKDAAPDREGADADLCRTLPKVMAVFDRLPTNMRRTVATWAGEMARGMAIYSHRPAAEDGIVSVMTLSDLERYCYFVAGTVGHMLTGLFLDGIDGLAPERARILQANSEEFGLGLQLVNILKDVTDDRERGVSFVPRSLCAEAGITVHDLTDPSKRDAAHIALGPIFTRARKALDGAFTYCLAIPAESRSVRLFCLLPLWMAVATLAHAKGNDDQFRAGAPVKIDRPMVYALIADAVARVEDDAALTAGFERLKKGGLPTDPPTSASPSAAQEARA